MNRANHRNYYRLLHVQPDAPEQIIKSSYRTLMQKLKQHPDLGGDHGNASLINEAYAVLTDPAKRAAYDRQLAQSHSKSAAAEARSTQQPETKTKTSVAKPPSPSRSRSAHVYSQTVHGNCAFCNTSYRISDSADDAAVCTTCASPLAPAKKFQQDTAGKRSTHRMEREQCIVFFTQWPLQDGVTGEVHDLSPYGMCIHADRPLPNGQIIKIVGHTLQAIGRVVNCRTPPQGAAGVYGIGVEFITLLFRKARGTFFSGAA